MHYQITPSSLLKATISLPASKSISNRALIINALSGSSIPPQNLSDCDDTFVMIRALSSKSTEVDIMAAGTAMRFLTAYFAVTPGERIITGTERMRNRPIAILVEALRKLGAQIEYVEREGYPPLRIRGGSYVGGELRLPGGVSSQYVSALLMIAPLLRDGLRLILDGEIISRPYIDLTLTMMRDFGAEASWRSTNVIEVRPTLYCATSYLIENDWSASSYWYQIVALAYLENDVEIQLPGLFKKSMQGDAQVQQIFESFGVKTNFMDDNRIVITNEGAAVSHFEYDFVNQPDLAQTVVVTCAMRGITFRISGLQSLKIKETDRMAALIKELGKLGYLIREENNSTLVWNGERSEIKRCSIDTYEDHRMAMSFAPCCIALRSICINEAQVVSKSYPRFWDDLRQAGFHIQEQQ